jgi:hypothetical protein
MRVPVSGRVIGCEIAEEHKRKRKNAMHITRRALLTVPGQRWPENETDRDGQELVAKCKPEGYATRFAKIRSVSGRPHVKCINNRIVFEKG